MKFIKNMEHIQYIINQTKKLFITITHNFMKLKKIDMKKILKNQQLDSQILESHAKIIHFY